MSCRSYWNGQLWFSTQYVPFIVYCLYTTNMPQCSSVRKMYLSEVWRWRTGWRHWAVDSSRRWGRPCSQQWRRMACWSWEATRKRLTMSHYQQHQTHDDVKLQQRPAAATKNTHTAQDTPTNDLRHAHNSVCFYCDSAVEIERDEIIIIIMIITDNKYTTRLYILLSLLSACKNEV